MLGPISAAQQHALLQADTGISYTKPPTMNRICAMRASKSVMAPLPRSIMESAPEVSASHVLWLQSCCYENGQGTKHEIECERSSEQSVATALANSCALLAAYCRADAVSKYIPEEQLSQFPGLIQGHQGAAGQASSDSSLARSAHSDWMKQRAAKRQKILVGLVRASSDQHFVGTLDSIMVHPGLRRRGLGRRLVTNACTKLFKIDVTDIGTWVAPGNEEFFRRCGFSVDKFNSVAMSLDRRSASGQLLASGAEESVGLDLQLMQETCKMQRIEQALLRYVIPA